MIERSWSVSKATLVAGLLANMVWCIAPAVAEVTLVPHHATYRLTLTKSSGDKAPASASGIISYDFTGSACEGYATTFRQVTELQPAEGESRVSDMRSATFEDGEARQFRFKTQTTYSSAPEDDIDGVASKGTDGTITVDLAKPAVSKAALKQALFPTEHLRKIIESAQAGRKLLSEPVYDGSESGTIIFDTLAVIGAPASQDAPEPAAQNTLASSRRWPVSISYFDQGKSDPQPSYVLSFDLYENGISRALRLDYGTFTLAGELVELKLLPIAACKK